VADSRDSSSCLDLRRVAADVLSSEPRRLREGLSALDRAGRTRPVGPICMPTVETLIRTFGDNVPEDVVGLFVSVVEDYPWFEPPAEPGERHATAFEAAMLVGDAQPAFDMAIAISADEDVEYSTRFVMRSLLRLPAPDAAAEDAIVRLTEVLLAMPDARRAVVDGLVSWHPSDDMSNVITRVSADLTEGERRRVFGGWTGPARR
jgi:hypothetical protein